MRVTLKLVVDKRAIETLGPLRREEEEGRAEGKNRVSELEKREVAKEDRMRCFMALPSGSVSDYA